MLTEHTFHTGSVSINYAESSSSGPPLVLLHGLPGRWQEFLPVIPALSTRWHLYALDLRGQGRSGRVPGGYRAKYYVDDLVSFLENVPSTPIVLFGQSAGGVAALTAAARVPDKIQAVIMGDSPIDIEMLLAWMTSEGFKHIFSAYRQIAGMDGTIANKMKAIADIPIPVPGQETPIRFGDRPDIDTTYLRDLAATLHYMDPGVLEYHAEGRAEAFFDGFDFEAVISGIRCPVLLLQADPDHGGMMTESSVEHALSILPAGSHVLLNELGHDLGLGTWETAPLLRAVMSFLESL